jgi:predicted GNAT family N-acyltransferase
MKPLTYTGFVHRFQIDCFNKQEQPLLFQQALHARIEVFVQREGLSLQHEPDAHDATARHWLVRTPKRRETVAYVRALPDALKPHCWHLSKLMVVPTFQEQDHARHLITYVIKQLQHQHQAQEIQLLTPEKTLTFFERLGFIPMGNGQEHAGRHWIPLHLYVQPISAR